MSKKAISIGLRKFDSQADAAKEFQRILKSAVGLKTRITDDEDERFLRDAVAMHPEAALKMGGGVDYFYIDAPSPALEHGIKVESRCFWIRRVDGTTVEFSFDEVISPSSPLDRLVDAARRAVEPRKKEFRASQFNGGVATCARCGGTIFQIRDSKVVHASPTMRQMVQDFAAGRGGVSAIHLVHGGAVARTGATFASRSDAESWLEHFDANARPQLHHSTLAKCVGGPSLSTK